MEEEGNWGEGGGMGRGGGITCRPAYNQSLLACEAAFQHQGIDQGRGGDWGEWGILHIGEPLCRLIIYESYMYHKHSRKHHGFLTLCV